jgi:hypothetical protein
VIGRPYTTAAGKTAHVRVKRVESDVTIGANLGHTRARRGETMILMLVVYKERRLRTP